MDALDDLFEQYLQELKNLGQAENDIRNYNNCFNSFRKLMVVDELVNFRTEKIIEFAERLSEIRHWDSSKNKYVTVKNSLLLSSINLLWSFFIWIKKSEDNTLSKNDHHSNECINEKMLFYTIYRQKFNFLLGYNRSNNQSFDSIDIDISNEISKKQLDKRFDYYSGLSDSTFYKGLADYVKYVSEKKHLLSIIIENIISEEPKNIESWIESCNHSDWGSWFNLEIVYLVIYKIKEMLKTFSENPEVINFLNQCSQEMTNIINNNCPGEPKYFSRNSFQYDFLRIHNLISETLERKSDSQLTPTDHFDGIVYKFHEFGIPNGELIIKGFDTIYFTKNRAKVIQFFYLNKENESYFSYQDFNEFSSSCKKTLGSNEFRLLIDSINHRVNIHSSGIIKHLIIKTQPSSKFNETNRYRFIK